jgi:putative ABC transport system permease protein
MIAGTFVLRDQIQNAFSSIFATAFQDTDVIVARKAAFQSDQAQDAGPLPASLIGRVAAVPGVRTARGQIQAAGSLVVDGKYLSSQGGAPNLVFSHLPEPFNQNEIVQGHFPSRPGEVAVIEKLASDHDLHVGEHVAIATDQGSRPVTIVGVFDFGTVPSIGGATVVETTFSDAQRWFDREGKTSVIVTDAEPGISAPELRRRVAATLPAGVRAQTGAQAAADQTERVAGSINGFLTPALLSFAGAAVFVGAFIIFNTFSITVAQRMREFALLRTVGATRRQILRSVLAEALAIGVIASALGIAAGIGFAKLLNVLFDAVGFGLPIAPITVAPRTVVLPLAVGTVMTLLSALVPGLRSTRVPPVAALREGAQLPPGRFAWLTPYVAVLFLAGGIAVVTYGVVADSLTTTEKLLLMAAGSIAVFLGVAMSARYLVRPLARAIGWPLQRLAPATGRIARENTMRNPARTAVTSAALMIGLGLVVFVAVFVYGFTQSFLGALDRSVKGDLIVQSRSSQFTIPASSLAAARRLPAVADVSGIESSQVKIGSGGTDSINGIDPATLAGVYSLDWQKGGSDALLRRLGPDQALVEEQFALAHNLDPGDTFSVTGINGRRLALRVAGQYKDPILMGGITVSSKTYAEVVPDANPVVVLAKYAPGIDADRATSEVKKGLEQRFPVAKVQTNQEYKDSVTDQVRQLLALLYVLLAMSVIISLFGIVNTLALSVFERTREIGMLRAIGTTRWQLRWMVANESVITAVIGGVLGIAIGILLSWIVTRGLRDQGIVFAVPYVQVAVSLVVAAIAGLIAAAFPARRAARLDVLQALQYE